MAKEKKAGGEVAKEKKAGTEQVLIRPHRELLDHVDRKVEEINKGRKARLEKPVNRQDVIKEIIRQDAVKSK